MDSFLDHIGIKYNCDKASLDRNRQLDSSKPQPEKHPGHNYLSKYEIFLEKFRKLPDVRFLELGAGPTWNIGASAKIWKEYFWRDDFRLHIVDDKELANQLKDQRCVVHIGNLEDEGFLTDLSKRKYDIIIDDASHLTKHQLSAFYYLFSSLNPGGIYIIEDIHTSFGPLRHNYHPDATACTYECMNYLATLVTGTGTGHPIIKAFESRFCDMSTNRLIQQFKKMANDISMIAFINHACIIQLEQFMGRRKKIA
jgi:hypothetical protein